MKTKLKRLPHGLLVAAGAAIGTAFYTAWLSAAQDVDWYRSVFVGAFAGAVAFLWPRQK